MSQLGAELRILISFLLDELVAFDHGSSELMQLSFVVNVFGYRIPQLVSRSDAKITDSL